ncbi:MAG: hypothetical protein ABH829_02790 [archaeon]
MKTRLVLYFNSEGGIMPSEVKNKVSALGFTVSLGNSDFQYNWGEKVPTTKDILALSDRVATALKGTKVIFRIKSEAQ